MKELSLAALYCPVSSLLFTMFMRFVILQGMGYNFVQNIKSM